MRTNFWLTISIVFFFMMSIMAQVPSKISYQAIIRNAEGQLVKNSNIGIRIQILKNSEFGAAVFVESHLTKTNDYGLVDLMIGNGNPVLGSLQSIQWGEGPYFIKNETDINGGNNYSIVGISELLSVPYALYAANGGVPGIQGPKGDQGVQGPRGEQGIPGPQGPKGDAGKDGAGVSIVGNVPDVSHLNPNYTGKIGDLIIATDTGIGYVWDGLNWVHVGQIQGERGPQGQPGPKGNDGTAGMQGPQGQKGDTGPQGLKGDTGPQGPQGNQGLTGPQGLQGDKGDTGAQGPQGIQGLKGDIGPAGPQGPQGPQGPPGASQWSQNGPKIYYNAGNVGIGTGNPEASLEVKGDLGLVDFSGVRKIYLSDLGYMIINGENGNPNFVFSYTTADPNNPAMSLTDDLGEPKVNLGVSNKKGYTDFYGPNGKLNVKIGAVSTNQNWGWLGVYDDKGDVKVMNTMTNSGSGSMSFFGANNSTNILLTHLNGYPDNGFISVHNSSGAGKAGMYVNASGQGQLYADVKNFKMDHPTDKNSAIWYASVEGPEAGAYDRGVASLVNGRTFIEYSDHFKMVINSSTVTVHLSPHSTDTYGLAVVQKTETGFWVQETKNGNGNFSFDWEVTGIRKGYENYQVIRGNESAMPALPGEIDSIKK
jgi:hypothetical protein